MTLPIIEPAETALFLDFDGTLVEIAPDPGAVVLVPAARHALESLTRALGGAVAILSGRELADLDRHLAPLRPAAAGGHGAERRRAGDAATETAPVPAVPPAILAELGEFALAHGLLLERKPAGASLHFRARPELEREARALADRLAGQTDGFRVIHGKMVAEIAPAARHKGAALEAFLAEPPFAGRRPIAVGDDRTDEDAFEAAIAAGGAAIKIGPGETAATHRLPDTAACVAWLAEAARRLGTPQGRRAPTAGPDAR